MPSRKGLQVVSGFPVYPQAHISQPFTQQTVQMDGVKETINGSIEFYRSAVRENRFAIPSKGTHTDTGVGKILKTFSFYVGSDRLEFQETTHRVVVITPSNYPLDQRFQSVEWVKKQRVILVPKADNQFAAGLYYSIQFFQCGLIVLNVANDAEANNDVEMVVGERERLTVRLKQTGTVLLGPVENVLGEAEHVEGVVQPDAVTIIRQQAADHRGGSAADIDNGGVWSRVRQYVVNGKVPSALKKMFFKGNGITTI